MTPVQLRARAQEHDRAGERAIEAGNAQLAANEFRRAELYRETAAELERGLRVRDQRGNAGNMVSAQRVRVSSGKNSAAAKDPLVVAANAKGYTLRSLAEVLKVSHALLSQARKGTSSIDKALAERVEELTGFAATKAHWPKIRS